ncbi:VWA domain-containing protein [uncultured Anaerococcus sp.]|uniref:VWA domain-containing protein n=1 Tax=uncultured Anaerococcus sp. TaxID=293428 RepID=UPI0025FADE65|nr:VWA domain-containing protein [uncultured Anaerococcus sp.]
MDKKNKKINENRIANIQWAGASAYDWDQFLVGGNIDDNPDFYINLIIGLSIKYLGHEEIKNLFDKWTYNLRRDRYDMALLFILEDFAYKKEIGNRPVLEDLRKAYAQKFLSDKFDLQRRNLALKENRIYRLYMAKNSEILGLSYKGLSKKDRLIYENLKLAPDSNETNVEKRVLDLLRKYLSYKDSTNLENLPSLHISLFENAGLLSLERSNMPKDFKGDVKKSRGFSSFILDFKIRKRKEKQSYIEKTFGKSLFDDKTNFYLNQKICTAGHKKSRVHFTKGIQKSDKNLNQDLNQKTIERHLLKFKANKNIYKTEIKRLSKDIKLKINQTSSFDYSIGKRGKVNPKLAYKAEISDRAKIFTKKNLTSKPSMKIDLVLDASASLLDKESEVAIEAYILAKSLENNGIANRVISFQTVGDYTILTILKDYEERAVFDNIFRFKSMGWNRDGLVFSAYEEILTKDFKNILSIVLTDANPQDLKPLVKKKFRINKAYEGEIGLSDSKKSLDKLRRKGLNICGIINSTKIENAKILYRNKFIKIEKATGIARSAGKFIKKQISSIEKS